MDRAHVVKDEIVQQDDRFLAVYLETKNSCLIFLSQSEDTLGTLAVAVPNPQDISGPTSSSILLGDRASITARMFAEFLAARKRKIAVVSVYLTTMDERNAQPILKRLLEKVILTERRKGEIAT